MSSIKNKVLALREYLNNSIESIPAFIASDRIHAWEILKNRPGTAKIAVGFESAVARVNFPGGDITGRENQTIYAIISRGRGLSQLRSADLVYGVGGGSPLFDLAEQMRDAMRAIRFDPTTDEPPDYVGLETWDSVGFDIDAFIARIWIGTQLPQPASTTNNLPPL